MVADCMIELGDGLALAARPSGKTFAEVVFSHEDTKLHSDKGDLSAKVFRDRFIGDCLAAAAKASEFAPPVDFSFTLRRHLLSLIDAVDAARAAATNGDKPHDERLVETVEPWGAPVDGVELLGEVENSVKRFLVLSQEQTDLIALWAVATHCLDACDTLPYLNIRGKTRELGKTRLLEVLEQLCQRSYLATGASVAVLFRARVAARL